MTIGLPNRIHNIFEAADTKRPPAESRWVELRLKVAGLRLKPPEGFPAESRLKARWAQ
jgi:hypothetical protein